MAEVNGSCVCPVDSKLYKLYYLAIDFYLLNLGNTLWCVDCNVCVMQTSVGDDLISIWINFEYEVELTPINDTSCNILNIIKLVIFLENNCDIIFPLNIT